MTTLTVAEYATACNEIRRLQSQLATSELEALRKQIANLKTAQGRTDQNRRAKQQATRYFETAIQADLIAGAYMLADRYGDTFEMGRARLEAATTEAESHDPQKDSRPPRHGTLRRYLKGCACAPCRKANAERVAEYRANRKATEQTLPVGATTHRPQQTLDRHPNHRGASTVRTAQHAPSRVNVPVH